VNSAARRAGRDDPDEPGWTNLARARRYREALSKLDEIEVEGELERASAQELLLLADAARFAGRPALAEKSLLAS
jgi:hypothetical protein